MKLLKEGRRFWTCAVISSYVIWLSVKISKGNIVERKIKQLRKKKNMLRKMTYEM